MNITGKRTNKDINKDINNDINNNISNKKKSNNHILDLIYYVKNIKVYTHTLFINATFDSIINEIKLRKINSNKYFIKYIITEIIKIYNYYEKILNILNFFISKNITNLDTFIENYEKYLNANTLLLLLNQDLKNEINYDSEILVIIKKINIIYSKLNNYDKVIKYIQINFKYTIYIYIKIIECYNIQYIISILNIFFDINNINNILINLRKIVNLIK